MTIFMKNYICIKEAYGIFSWKFRQNHMFCGRVNYMWSFSADTKPQKIGPEATFKRDISIYIYIYISEGIYIPHFRAKPLLFFVLL